MHEQVRWCVVLLSLALAGGARAALIDRGNGLIYDDVLNVTWLQDANLAASNTFGLGYNTDLGNHPDDLGGSYYSEVIFSDGSMTWGAALHWIDAMNAAAYKGFSDWRLPNLTDLGGDGCNFAYAGTDCGFNVDTATSELASLWYDSLGNPAYYDTAGNGPQAGWGLPDTGPFINLRSALYWTGTQYALDTLSAWNFDQLYGLQAAASKNTTLFVLAVRTGDVPEPGVVLSLALGLAGLGMGERLRRR